jgi:hypothetical protein
MLLNFAAPRLQPNVVQAPESNIDRNAILGLSPSKYSGLQNVRDTGYYYGNNRMYEPYTITRSAPSYYGLMYGMGGGSNRAEGTIEVGDQAFRPVDVDITGFSKSKADGSEIYNYDPSMAYVLSQTPRSIPAPTPNVTSFLSTPTAMATPTGNYGAGRYLSGLLGSPISYGLPNDQTGSDS